MASTHAANDGHQRLLAAHSETPGSVLSSEALVDEFRHSMAGLTASAAAMDGFYASVKARLVDESDPQASGPPGSDPAKRPKRTPRATQVCNVLATGYELGPRAKGTLSRFLPPLYRIQNLAVHATSQCAWLACAGRSRASSNWLERLDQDLLERGTRQRVSAPKRGVVGWSACLRLVRTVQNATPGLSRATRKMTSPTKRNRYADSVR